MRRSPASWVGGVLGGVAERYRIDPLLARGVFVAVCMVSAGLGLLAYAAAWAVLPDADGRVQFGRLRRGEWQDATVAIGVIGAIGALKGPLHGGANEAVLNMLRSIQAEGIKPERIESFLEDRDEYASQNVFWVPSLARWGYVQSVAKQPEIGQQIDQAMDLIEKENPSLRGVLPRNYGRDGLDKRRLGELVDLIGSIGFTETDDHGADDVLGRVYEYFLGQFAGKETGKDAGAFYTPRSVVKTLVEMLEPFKGRVYDPAVGSGGMFVQAGIKISS